MDSGGSGHLYGWTGGPRTEDGVESGANSGAAQPKGGGWEGSQDMEGDREWSTKQCKKWDRDR